MKSLGYHVLAEFYDCCAEVINSVEKVEDALMESVRISGATIIKPVFHKFNPHGVSGVVVIAESHFSVHTWPEYGYCAVDIFTCGETIDSRKSINFLKERFSARRISLMEVKRGMLDLPQDVIKHKPDLSMA
jgi:S-adenosylmethionine decarboxylase